MIENEMIIDEKIRKLGSKIMSRAKEYSLIETKLKEIYENKKIILKQIYKGTRDGDDAKSFHSKCDDLQGSLILIKSDDEVILADTQKENGVEIVFLKKIMLLFYFHFILLKYLILKKIKELFIAIRIMVLLLEV